MKEYQDLVSSLLIYKRRRVPTFSNRSLIQWKKQGTVWSKNRERSIKFQRAIFQETLQPAQDCNFRTFGNNRGRSQDES